MEEAKCYTMFSQQTINFSCQAVNLLAGSSLLLLLTMQGSLQQQQVQLHALEKLTVSIPPALRSGWLIAYLVLHSLLLTPSSPLYLTSPAPGLDNGFLTLTSNHRCSSSLDGTFIAYGIVDQY